MGKKGERVGESELMVILRLMVIPIYLVKAVAHLYRSLSLLD